VISAGFADIAVSLRGHGAQLRCVQAKLGHERLWLLEEPHALLVVDASGSMGAHEYALGPIVWIVTTAFRAVGGKAASLRPARALDACTPRRSLA
jgi:hypothetical protein